MRLFTAVLFALTCFFVSADHTFAKSDEQKAILVTGATSGIGRNLAERLARDGHFVYAGARKQADMDELNAIDNITAVRLDVTIQEDIDAAVEFIRDEGRGLYGLVNNAGVVVVGPLIEVDERDMQFQMDVNTFGPYRVTKAFAPLIIESKGRITTTSSISGVLSGPFIGPYSMSKHAIEAYVDSLAEEMKKFDVAVSVIEPGNYNSSIIETTQRRAAELGQSAENSLFEDEFGRVASMPTDRSVYKEPDEVSDAFVHFLFSDNPNRRYMVVPNEREAEITIRKAMTELVQLNDWQAYSYDRDKLVSILDEVLEANAE